MGRMYQSYTDEKQLRAVRKVLACAATVSSIGFEYPPPSVIASGMRDFGVLEGWGLAAWAVWTLASLRVLADLADHTLVHFKGPTKF